MTTNVDANELGITFSEVARSKLLEVLTGYPEEVAGLRLKIAGRTSEGFEHVLTIVEQGYEPEGDVTADYPDFTLYVEGERVDDLRGTAIHYEFKGPNVSGLEFNNPNPVWRDPLAQAIQQIFDEQVNPQIAAHGGYVQLLEVKGSKAYIEMGGGCQGCGMANVTLKQGVEVAVKEQLPEIDELIDVTDHQSGENPYYQPSKK
ncbi:MAG: NifU family protein [Chloroflexota bacterium]|nr:NifU family protein [Chloroflexota bacterium]MDE2896129.1 NifU family protein [Chloroflexota bacterium]